MDKKNKDTDLTPLVLDAVRTAQTLFGSKLPEPDRSAHSTLPRITLVTPSFNQAQYLEACIDSVLSQNYPNLEYIVMDGGSTDGSVEIIKRYTKHLTYWQI